MAVTTANLQSTVSYSSSLQSTKKSKLRFLDSILKALAPEVQVHKSDGKQTPFSLVARPN